MTDVRGGPWTLAVAVLAALACTPAPPERAGPPASLRVELDRSQLPLGETATYTLTLVAQPGVEVDVPQPEALGEVPVVGRTEEGPQALPGGEHRRRIGWRLQPSRPGIAVLPALSVPWRRGGAHPAEGQLEAAEVFVEVGPAGAAPAVDAGLRPIKPPWALARARPWLWALAVAAAGAVAWWTWRRRRRPPRAVAAPPAHAIALAKLRALRQVRYDDAAAVRRYFFAVSTVVRAYVEARFALNATDLTTEEILHHIRALPALDGPARDQLQKFLASTDGVKYAGRRPARAQVDDLYDQAVRFVELTQAPPPAAAPAAKDGR